MSRNFYFFLLVGMGLIIIGGGLYYIFGYQVMEKESVLGIVIKADKDILDDEEIISELEERKIGVVQLYIDWGDIENKKGEYNWQILDKNVYDLAAQGYRVSLCITNINGYGLGTFPDDFNYIGLNDSVYQERFSEFILALNKRYKNDIDYLQLGNEVDKFLLTQTHQITSFVDFYNYVYTVVKEDYPNLQIGTVISYDFSQNTGNLNSLMRSWLSINVDFLGFSFYNIDNNLEIKNIDNVEHSFKEMLGYADIEKIGLVSTGLSEAAEYDQSLFLEKLLKVVSENEEQFEFVNYYYFKNPGMEYCLAEAAEELWKKLEVSSYCQDLEYQGGECNESMVTNQEKQNLANWKCSFGVKSETNFKREIWRQWPSKVQEYQWLF